MQWVIQSWLSRDKNAPGFVRYDTDDVEQAIRLAAEKIRLGNAVVLVDMLEE
jgi:hypothetical protein